ncbi:hypothetical protein L4D76_16840 [Photobacterium sagamiensis]|uniref:YncE family protein n=1 Tax=Photobacterium sagamiensis TaxID=2910241 RepID=UPI003D09DCFD
MKPLQAITALFFSVLIAFSFSASAEILAMLNYESKPADNLKELKLPFATQNRREGIAIIDVDPESDNYGNILMDIQLPPDLVAHHIFFNRDASKAYVTALGKSELRIIDMKSNPFRMKVLVMAGCQVGEDTIFSEDNKTWYTTCMGSNKVIVGNAVTDEITQLIDMPKLYPHGIALNSSIDRLLVTSTVRASDLGDPGETITVIQASTGKVLSHLKVSDKPSPSGEAPVEILFVPGTNPPVAYITNMFGNSLWTASWNPGKDDFDVAMAYDFSGSGASVPLEIYFRENSSRMYVSTAKPGHLHIFDISDQNLKAPKLIKTLPGQEGSHHVAFTKDGSYAFIQNAFVNLPGMNDGSITVVDLKNKKVLDTINTFKDKGFNPNSIVLLPEWNDLAGH